MFIKIKKTKKTTTLIFLGVLLISLFSSTITFNPIDEQSEDILESDDNVASDQSLNEEDFEKIEQIDELNYYSEEKPDSTYDRNAIEWQPVGENLRNSPFNEELSVGGIETISYNAITGIETVTTPKFTPTPESSTGIRKVEPYAGLLTGGTGAEAVTGNPTGDQRTIITNQNVYPYRTIVKLYMAAPWGGGYVGSGAVIDNYHILTAGHCAYLRDAPNEGWATSIEVVAAMDTSDTPSDPYGSAWVTNMRSYTGWTVSGSAQHDWAVLTLDRNIGIYTGWMGRMTAGSGSAIYDQLMNVAGYPTDVASGNRLIWDDNDGDGATANNHFYWADTGGGESGGPVWRYSGGSRYILTTHAYGPGNPDANFGTRLNNDKYDRIFTWLAADTAPTDKADLIDNGGSAVNSYSVTAGISSFDVDSNIRNVGTASSGTYYVHYYASTNDYISTSDYYLGTSSAISTGAFGTVPATWAGTFPNIPGGNYYIGWIIDKDDNVDEFDEGNNKGYHNSQVSVTGQNPPISYIEVTVRDSITSAYIPSAYVRCYVAGTSTLVDSGYTDGSGFYNIANLAVGDYDVKVTKSGYMDQTKFNTIHNLAKGYDDDYLTFNLVPHGPDTSWIEVNVKDSGTTSPLSSAFVQVVNMSSGLVLQTGYTNGAGFYNVTGLWIGWYEITVTRFGYAPQTKQNYINWNYDDDYLTFYLEQKPIDSGYIEVRVYNETGGPKENVYVECYYDNGTYYDDGWTDSSGFYNVTGLIVGWYDVNTTFPGYYEQSRSNYINWRGDDDYLSFYLDTLPPNSGFIEVTAYDSFSFLALSNAFVEVTNVSSGLVIDTGYTDGSGFYKIVNLTIGLYSVEVIKDGYYGQTQQTQINWAGDDDYLTYYLDELPPDSGYIEVTVIDNDTLLPIVNATVTCNYLNGTYFTSGTTDSSGLFNVTGLYVGWYTIEVSHSDYGGDSMNNYINWNGDNDYITFYLELKPPGWIEVRVYDAYNNNPIPNAYVRCFNKDSGELFDDGYTDSSGFYNITGLPIGWWIVNVSHPAFVMDSSEDYIHWRGDVDYLTFYLDITFEPITGPIAIFQDVAPWTLNVTEQILVNNSLSFTMYNSSDMGAVDLSVYQKVIVSSDQTQHFYDSLASNTTWFESYVTNGGILLLSTCDYGWAGGNWNESYLWPGGLSRTHVYFENVSINIHEHPALLAPSLIEDDELDNWNHASHGYFTTYPTGTKEILLDANTLNPVLVEFEFGNGFFIATNQPLEWNHNLSYTRLLENLILYDPTFYVSSINVTTPDNSSVWLAGLAQSIYWNSTGNIVNVRIDLYKNATFLTIIDTSTPNDGVFSWDVPLVLESSDLYQIRVSDAEYPVTFDDSEYFEIYNFVESTPGIPGYNLGLLILFSVGISIILLKKKHLLKINN